MIIMAHSYADVGGFADFTVTPSVSSGRMKFTLTDSAGKVTDDPKMIRAIIGDAIDQWLLTNAAQLVTNSVTVGNDSSSDDFGGSNLNRPSGDGFLNITWDFGDKFALTPALTTTSLTTAAITVAIPYADVCG